MGALQDFLESEGYEFTWETQCIECGRQMHKYNEQKWGKNQDYWRYICIMGHIRYIKVKKP